MSQVPGDANCLTQLSAFLPSCAFSSVKRGYAIHRLRAYRDAPANMPQQFVLDLNKVTIYINQLVYLQLMPAAALSRRLKNFAFFSSPLLFQEMAGSA